MRVNVPVLAALFESPGYEACRIIVPGSPITVMEQLVVMRLHVFPEGNVAVPVPPT